jgi:hypothetical protein
VRSGPSSGNVRDAILVLDQEDCPMDTPTPETMSQPMDTSSDQLDGSDAKGWGESPVDDATYNVMMALASKLEGIDVYRVYAEDGSEDLWRSIAKDDRRHADLLLTELKRRLAGS